MIVWRRLVPALVGVLAWIGLPLGVAAHAELLGSEPGAGAVLSEPPERIRLWFTEPVVPGFTDVALLDGLGRRLDRGGAALETGDTALGTAAIPELGPGVYTISWRALSAVDGHLDRGVVVFVVGNETAESLGVSSSPLARWDFWLGSLTRWASYAAAAVLAGTTVFHLPTRWTPRGAGRARVALGDRGRRRLGILTVASATVLTTATLSDLALHSMAAADSWSVSSIAGATEGLIVRTRFGAIWLARLVLAFAIMRMVGQAIAPPTDRSDRWTAAAFLSALLLFTFSVMSHASAATSSGWLGISASWLHLAVVAVWLGGLANLALLSDNTSSLLGRFSAMAGLAVLVLVATGVLQGLMLVGTGPALMETDYGRALLLKLVAVAGALLLAYASRRAVERWLQHRGTGPAGPSLGRGPAIHTGGLRAELMLIGAALGITGVLAGLPPAWQAYQQLVRSRPVEIEVRSDGQSWALRLDPGRPGSNQVSLQPPDAVTFAAARLLLTATEVDLPSTSVTLSPSERGTWLGTATLGVSGRWQSEAVLRRPDGGDVLIRFPFDLAGPATALPQPPILSGGVPSATAVVAMGLVVLGLFLTAFVLRTTGLSTWEGRGLAAATVAIVVLGAYVALRPQPSEAIVALNARAATNPIAPSDDSLARGAEVYRADCAACHGDSGQGDGPQVTARGERLSDLRVHLSAGHTDGDLYYWITRGIAGTEMPAFGDSLSETDRWHLVNFLRTL